MSEEYYSKPNVERPLGVTIIALIGIVYSSIFIISILLLSFLALFAPAGGVKFSDSRYCRLYFY